MKISNLDEILKIAKNQQNFVKRKKNIQNIFWSPPHHKNGFNTSIIKFQNDPQASNLTMPITGVG